MLSKSLKAICDKNDICLLCEFSSSSSGSPSSQCLHRSPLCLLSLVPRPASRTPAHHRTTGRVAQLNTFIMSTEPTHDESTGLTSGEQKKSEPCCGPDWKLCLYDPNGDGKGKATCLLGVCAKRKLRQCIAPHTTHTHTLGLLRQLDQDPLPLCDLLRIPGDGMAFLPSCNQPCARPHSTPPPTTVLLGHDRGAVRCEAAGSAPLVAYVHHRVSFASSAPLYTFSAHTHTHAHRRDGPVDHLFRPLSSPHRHLTEAPSNETTPAHTHTHPVNPLLTRARKAGVALSSARPFRTPRRRERAPPPPVGCGVAKDGLCGGGPQTRPRLIRFPHTPRLCPVPRPESPVAPAAGERGGKKQQRR